MKKNKIIPFSLLFITLTFLELFCIVKYSDVFYFPLAVGVTLLGSAYLLLTEITHTITSFVKERDEKANEIKQDEAAIAEKDEAAKLAKATYVLEKRILNLLEERILMPEENIENLSSLQLEIVRAIKASIKYDRENTNHIADVISDNSVTYDNSMSPADLSQILAKFDTLALEIKSSQLTMSSVKEQLQTITDIARQISNNGVQSITRTTPSSDTSSVNNLSVADSSIPEHMETITETVSFNDEAVDVEDTTQVTEGLVTETEESPEIAESENTQEYTPEFVDTLTISEPETSQPVTAVVEDPNKQMSPEDIAALFAASEPAPEPVKDIPAEDPNKQMSPEDIAALFAASEPAPEPVKDIPAEDPNKQMSPEDIAALFASANLDLEPEPSAPAPKTAIEALSKPKPEVTPVSDDPNKKMSPEDIAALFASAGQ